MHVARVPAVTISKRVRIAHDILRIGSKTLLCGVRDCEWVVLTTPSAAKVHDDVIQVRCHLLDLHYHPNEETLPMKPHPRTLLQNPYLRTPHAHTMFSQFISRVGENVRALSFTSAMPHVLK
jgi:hypothetical protein